MSAAISDSVLDTLLEGSGVDESTFFEEYWQKRTLFAPGSEANTKESIEQRASLLTSGQIFSSLGDSSLPACGSIELVISDRTVGRNGRFVTPEGVNLSSDNSCEFAQLNADLLAKSKATLLLPHVDEIWEKLHNFSCNVQRKIGGFPTGINAYLSPAPTKATSEGLPQRGFLMHRDGHDLIVVQVEGQKVWEICEPKWEDSKLSTYGFHYGPDFIPDEGEFECFERRVTRGDVVYLPRGTLHAPRMDSGSSGSLHLSMGIDVRHFRYVDVLLAHVKSEGLVEALAVTSKQTLAGCSMRPTTRCVAFSVKLGETSVDNDDAVEMEEWTWARLLGEMCTNLPDRRESKLGNIARRAIPMHTLSLVPAPEKTINEYIDFISALKKECGDILGRGVFELFRSRGHSIMEASAAEAAVRERCADIVGGTFTRASFESVIAETMSRAGYRVTERRCSLPPWHEWKL